MNAVIKICEHCRNEFETKNSRRKYCGDTCKTYASQVRKGKRDPEPVDDVVSIGNLSPEQKKQLLKELEVLETNIIQAKREHELFLDKRFSEKSNRKINDELSFLHDKLNRLGEDEAEKKKLENKIEVLAKQRLENEEYNKRLYRMVNQNHKDIDSAFVKKFRAEESRNDFVKRYFLSSEELTGASIATYQSVQTRYPFEDLDHVFFAALGKPIQPFLVSITGEKESGKSILGVLASIELVDYFKAKVLYVADPENRRKVIDYFTTLKVDSTDLVLKFGESLQDIEKALFKDAYEFLFIDSNMSFKLNFTNIKTLQKKYPKLSIFSISRHNNSYLVESSSIRIETETNSMPDYGVVKSASAEVFIDGVINEDQSFGIFLNNESNGFKINF